MQRADETPDMITIHSMRARRERERERGREGGRERRRKMAGGGDRGGRVREQKKGVKVRREGAGEEGWGERDRGRSLFIPVGDNDDLIVSPPPAVSLSDGRAS